MPAALCAGTALAAPAVPEIAALGAPGPPLLGPRGLVGSLGKVAATGGDDVPDRDAVLAFRAVFVGKAPAVDKPHALLAPGPGRLVLRDLLIRPGHNENAVVGARADDVARRPRTPATIPSAGVP